MRWQQEGFKNQFVTLEVYDVGDVDALGNEPLSIDGEVIGRATGGTYGWRVGKSLALGFIHPNHATEGTELEISILGEPHRTTIIPESPYDPDNERLRA